MQFPETADFLANFEWLRDALNHVMNAVSAVTFLDLGELPPAANWGEKLALYRFIVFGALLVAIMVLRPAGLFPSKRRELEFEQPPEAETAFPAGAA
jgi:ABC-type branched-subunit amino acid transport system permease subunit